MYFTTGRTLTAEGKNTVGVTYGSQQVAASLAIEDHRAPAAPKKAPAEDSASGIQLGWKAVDGATGYAIYRLASYGTLHREIAVVGQVTEYFDATAEDNVSYEYLVMPYLETENGSTYITEGEASGRVICATETDSEFDSCNHQFDAGEIVWEPTETAAGLKVYTCTLCGATKSESIAPSGAVVPGDVNGDGDVDTVDAIRLARFLVDLVELTDAQIKAADVTGDDDVTTTDAIRLARYLVGFVETLRPEPAKAEARARSGIPASRDSR